MEKSLSLFILSFAVSFLISSGAAAQSSTSRFTYDVSGSSGTRDNISYSEIHLGLNWFVNDWFNWRNSLFTQFGSEINSVYGLDSAALFNAKAYTQNKSLGVEVYAGPGVRLATEKSNAVFGKAGITFALAGIRIGGGVQALHYLEDRQDKNNRDLGKDETQLFLVLAGGGAF